MEIQDDGSYIVLKSKIILKHNFCPNRHQTTNIKTTLVSDITLGYRKKTITLKIFKPQPEKNGQNEMKTITDAKQETKLILTKAQKKLQMEYQKQFIQQQRAKEDIKAAKPQEIVNLPPEIYPEIRNLQKQINQEGPQVPNQVNQPMHLRQCESGKTGPLTTQ
ncbi:Hypothetical_protein [Hexamita inflata]|uniref:Hypothetical_protein n=1 Tax=Hexamita inflata TaxID=28002 RepID=A0ABP1I8Y9_9EUKA